MIVVSRKWFRVGMIVVNMIVALELWKAQNLNSQAFLSLPCGPGGGAGSDRKTLVLELWEAQHLNSQVFLSLPCGPGGGGGQ